MGDLAVDHTLLLGQGGAEVIHVPVSEIATRAGSAPAAEVRRLMEEDRRQFEIDPELRPDEHELSSRLEHALRGIVRDYRLDAFTFHFKAVADDGRIGTLPVLGASKLLAEGIGYAGEGDVTCAALVAMMARLAGESEFFETWGLDFAGGALMKNHMGEGNFRLGRRDLPVRLLRAPIGLGDVVAPAVPSLVMRPGEATLANLTTGRGGALKLTVCEGNVPEMTPVRGVLTPHGKFIPDVQLKEFLERFAYAGGSHHSALAYGRWSGSLQRLAWMMGWELETIQNGSGLQPSFRRNSR
jgi:L-arabinose isomerase